MTLSNTNQRGSTLGSNNWDYARNFLLFAVMGSGANWVLATALSEQIPYFETHLPEGYCIATYMNASTASGIIFTLTYLGLKSNGYVIPFSYSVPSILVASSLVSFFSAAVYNLLIDNTSVFLFLCCMLSGAIGSLSAVILSPFMTKFENDYISAARVGGSGAQIICAVLAAIQQPGSSNILFSTSIYLMIFGFYFIAPILCYMHIVKYDLGAKKDEDEVKRSDKENGMKFSESDRTDRREEDADSEIALTNLIAENSSSSSENDIGTNEFKSSRCGSGNCNIRMINMHNYGNANKSNTSTSTLSVFWHRVVVNRWLFNEGKGGLVPKSWIDASPWIQSALPYMLTIGFINFNTWGMLSALTPFAFVNATTSGAMSASESLSIALQLTTLTLVSGDYSTTLFKLRFDYCIYLFAFFVGVIYLSATGVPIFHTPAAAPLLIILYCSSRFLEAHMVTSIYRVVATHYSPEDREAVSQAVGLTDQVSTVLGAIVSTTIVSVVVGCGGGDDDSR